MAKPPKSERASTTSEIEKIVGGYIGETRVKMNQQCRKDRIGEQSRRCLMSEVVGTRGTVKARKEPGLRRVNTVDFCVSPSQNWYLWGSPSLVLTNRKLGIVLGIPPATKMQGRRQERLETR